MDRPITALEWALVPAAVAASAALWPWCVVTAYWLRAWSDALDDAALTLIDHDRQNRASTPRA